MIEEPDVATIHEALELAVRHHGAGQLAEAEGIYRQILDADPDHAVALHHLGVIAHQVGRNDLATELIGKAIALEPGFASAHSNLANALRELGRLDDAVASCKRAIALEPTLAEAHTNLANALKDLGRLDDAVACYREAIVHAPDFAMAHNNLGSTLRDLGRADEAVASCRTAVALDPAFAEAHTNLGNALQDLGRVDDAVASYREAIALRPDFAVAHANLGNTLLDAGRMEDSVASFERAIALKPDLASAHTGLGKAFQDLGRLDASIASYRRALAARSGIHPDGREDECSGVTSLMLELTNRCNFHCEFCPSDSQTRSSGFMDFDLVRRLYDEVAEKKLVDEVSLHLMGEPTLHPDFLDILAYAAEKDVKTCLVTNGSAFGPRMVPRLLDALYGTLVVSLQTPTAATFPLRGKIGLTWERYVDGIRSLLREKIGRTGTRNIVDIRVLVTSNTNVCVDVVRSADEIRSIYHEWSGIVADMERDLGLEPFNRTDIDTRSFSEDALPKLKLQKGVSLTFWRAFTFANARVAADAGLEEADNTGCMRPFLDVGVLWNGDVTLCCLDYDGKLVIGDVRTSSVEAVLNCGTAKSLRASMLSRGPLPRFCVECQKRPGGVNR